VFWFANLLLTMHVLQGQSSHIGVSMIEAKKNYVNLLGFSELAGVRGPNYMGHRGSLGSCELWGYRVTVENHNMPWRLRQAGSNFVFTRRTCLCF
jgi:hypothetical protein